MKHILTPKGLRGFSLIELMVGIVVALLTTVVIFRSYQAYEGQRRSTGAASDAVANGQFVVQELDRDITQAGWGFQYGRQGLGCDFSAGYALGSGTGVFLPNAATATRPANIGLQLMMPVLIADGSTATGGNQYTPDAIRVMYSSSETAVPYSGSVSGTTFSPTSAVGMQQGDLLLLQNATNRTCQLAQVTNNNPTTATGLFMETGTGPCLPNAKGVSPFTTDMCPSGSAFNQAAGLAGASWVSNLGTLTVHTYTINGKTLSNYSAVLGNTYDQTSATQPLLNVPGYINRNTSTTLDTELSQDIVNIQAQYGIDPNRTNTQDPARVSNVTTWVDATGNWLPTQMGQLNGGVVRAQQVRAIRVLVVTRSAQPEKKDTSGNCSATNTTVAPTSIRTITWPNGDTKDIDLSVGTGTDWRCYRYQTFMNIMPLRNSIWNALDYER
ncbi:PilW family protein [Chitinimonas naiadis]